MSDLRHAAVETLARWGRNILDFARECLHLDLDESQKDALRGVQQGSRAAFIGAKGCGKTLFLGVAVWWFLLTRPNSNIAVTSVSGDNLRDGLWKELASLQARSPILLAAFEWQATRIVSREAPATWWASARTWSRSADKEQQSQTLAGLHAPFTMFVIDEGSGVPLAVSATAEAALASGKECKLILAGNPTSLDGPLYAAAVTHRNRWHVTRISGAPDDPKRSPRVNIEWARQQIEMFGADSPWVRVNVYGEFPKVSINALFGVEEVQASMTRSLRPEAYLWAQKRLGIDAARYGDDVTAIFPRQGLMSWAPIEMRHERGSAVSVDIATRVSAARAKWGDVQISADATGGWAAGFVDVLRSNGIDVYEVQFHAPAMDTRYRNRRAELWFAMASWLQRGGKLPNLPELVPELVSTTFTYGTDGKFILEPKDLVKQRLGRSPDRADALATTFALEEQPAALAGERGSIGRAVIDWDVYAEDPVAERARARRESR